MQDNSEITLALIAIVGTVITALFKLLNDNTKALQALVAETKDGNDKAEARNGHLGNQNVEIANIAKDISRKLDQIDTQQVNKQTVEHQTVVQEEK